MRRRNDQSDRMVKDAIAKMRSQGGNPNSIREFIRNNFPWYKITEEDGLGDTATPMAPQQPPRRKNDPPPAEKQYEQPVETELATPVVTPAASFEETLRSRMVGQEHAIDAVLDQWALLKAGAVEPRRPLGIMMMLGPTGVGKTLLAESVAVALHGSPDKMIKVNCGEFQLEHEIAKLIGSPPGFIGHGAEPILSQDAINTAAGNRNVAVILIDEVEKAHENLFRMLLGVLDKGTMTSPTGKIISFRRCMIFMTSNVGAREIATLSGDERRLGFRDTTKMADASDVERIARMAMRVKFTPEFIGRIDQTIVFRALTADEFSGIFDKEVEKIGLLTNIRIAVSTKAKKELIAMIDVQYGARSMKQILRKMVTLPTAKLRNGSDKPVAEVKVDWKNGGTTVSIVTAE